VEVELTTMEYELLLLFASNPGRDFSRDDILAALRGIDAALLTRSVDILVSRLRAKLGDTSRPGRIIHTVWGRGYRFTAQPLEPA
jgi:DNA-binding response OmpR family regulator